MALVGPSGAGKTTLFQLLLRFYDPAQGGVRLHGVDVRQLALQALRGQLGIVLQDTVIFAGSVADNIRYGRPDASDAEVRQAAQMAAAAEFIEALPQGYATFLGERGVRLSGGQRQPHLHCPRDIARSTDPAAGRGHQCAGCRQRTPGATGAGYRGEKPHHAGDRHRLATVQAADRIVVMDAGRIVAEGSHRQLLQSSPLYARLAAFSSACRRLPARINRRWRGATVQPHGNNALQRQDGLERSATIAPAPTNRSMYWQYAEQSRYFRGCVPRQWRGCSGP